MNVTRYFVGNINNESRLFFGGNKNLSTIPGRKVCWNYFVFEVRMELERQMVEILLKFQSAV